LINADSIIRIECTQVISPAQKLITMEETQTKSGIKVTLHKIEFSDKNTRVYLTVDNNNKNTEISFYDFNSKAIQGNRQFETTTDYDVDYPEIESDIPAGIVEDGVILFEPLEYKKNNLIEKSSPENIISKSNSNQVSNPISTSGNFKLLSTWGSPGTGDGQFNHPASIEHDPNGQRIYIADLDNNRIQVLNSDGEFVTKWGTLGKGDGQFSGPGDIASDPSVEFIYFMDIDNNRVQKFDKNGKFIMEWGSLGIGDGEAKLILQNYEKHEELFTSLYIMDALYYYA
jgi:DNA-binding beta-propeller fold protein YncE